jgi:hypothetical protein
MIKNLIFESYCLDIFEELSINNKICIFRLPQFIDDFCTDMNVDKLSENKISDLIAGFNSDMIGFNEFYDFFMLLTKLIKCNYKSLGIFHRYI